MKKTELKNVLKPLIKQCVKEILLEEGVLSNVVSEVARGLSPLLVENRNSQPIHQNNTVPELEQALLSSHKSELLEKQRAELHEEKQRMIKEQKRKILNATGFGAEIFEGVEPIASVGNPDAPSSPGALADVSPSDPGVDISGIMALGGHKWNKLI